MSVVKYPLEQGIKVIIIEDGYVVENTKLDSYHKFTIITQDNKLIDAENTTRKRYRKINNYLTKNLEDARHIT